MRIIQKREKNFMQERRVIYHRGDNLYVDKRRSGAQVKGTRLRKEKGLFPQKQEGRKRMWTQM